MSTYTEKSETIKQREASLAKIRMELLVTDVHGFLKKRFGESLERSEYPALSDKMEAFIASLNP